jgi:acyl-CoA synthetase (AMP-forming)/AMP-acid ligase II
MTLPQASDATDPRTFPQLLRKISADFGEDIAITLTGKTIADVSISFAELDRKSAALAKGLIARGVGKGSRIGFIYGNGPTFVVLLAAITRIGAIAVPFSTLIKGQEMVRVLRQSDVQGVIVQRTLLGHDYVDRLCDALPELKAANPDLRIADVPYLRWIVSTGDALPVSVRDMDWLLGADDGIGDALLQAVEAEVHPTDQMLEIYTSGSMALPKGVKHLHGPVMFRAHYIARMMGRSRDRSTAAVLPMFWVGGLGIMTLPGLVTGSLTVCTEGTSTSSRHAMGIVMADEDLAVMRQSKPFWGLGMSETFGPYSFGDELRAPGYPLCAPIDHIADGYEVRVADATGTPVADGAIGEVQVRGYALTPGLHKMEREGYFMPDGFYHTGDLAVVEGNRIHFVGRDGDMIKTAGSNVSPGEVEMEMAMLDGVHSAYVVGVPDPDRGELVTAAVVAREGATLDFTQMEAELRKRLSSYKVPRAFIQISRDEVPMLISNKVSRRDLVALMKNRLACPTLR